MLSKILGSFGGFLGGALGGGSALTSALKFAGKYIGNYITQSAHDPQIHYSFSSSLDDVTCHPNNIPFIIPIIFGKAKVQGRIIWASHLKESKKIEEKVKYFKDSSFARSKKYHTEYLYSGYFALLLAEGEISNIGRVWINGKEYDISPYNYRFYEGSDTQMPDPLIIAHEKNAPAFRGISYIVFENFPLKEFGNKIPHFEFEITKKAKKSISDKVRNICLIPGSGEFVYDTILVEKIYSSKPLQEEIYKEYINCHNPKKIADALYNLDKLQENFKNLESVSLVVTWFADNLDAGSANIYPAIESRNIKSSIEWRVAGFTRENARIISKDSYGIPNYGGTINDDSLRRYLEELKSRGIKILFNPMIFLDIEGKPWRGHIKARPDEIGKFFAEYRKFILHYASLAKDYIDSFLIGSELKSLTSIRYKDAYPSVEELIKLAKDVRDIFGRDVKISYGADWSEYHHAVGGYYNLDKLWADENIDFIGIDAYFPLTNSTSSQISKEEIANGFESGEGFDFYHDGSDKKPLEPEWAWKNIRYWWENYHYNSDGSKTPWIPKSKKIIFTEFGFPSIDKAPNQPNVFYDSNSIDGGVPKFSTGEVDFEIQTKSISAFLHYWENSDMVDKSFLWAWDVRPQPAWPHMKIWRDSNLWQKGHYVNDKLSSCNLSDILSELALRSSFKASEIRAEKISEDIEGLVLDKDTSSLDTILMLKILFRFHVIINPNGSIEFFSSDHDKITQIDAKNFIKEGEHLVIKDEKSNADIASEIRFSYLSSIENYQPNYLQIKHERISFREAIDTNISICMNREKARYLVKRIINSNKRENINYSLILSLKDANQFKIGDKASFLYLGQKEDFKITKIALKNYKFYIEGSSY